MNQRCHNFVLIAFKESFNKVGIAVTLNLCDTCAVWTQGVSSDQLQTFWMEALLDLCYPVGQVKESTNSSFRASAVCVLCDLVAPVCC